MCGVKDLLRGKRKWTFEQSDIVYKRVQIAMEIMDQRVDGFEDY
jgi:hypothetical protein